MRQLCQILSFCCCLLGWAAAGFAQEQLLSWEFIGENKGLNTLGITNIHQDKVGYFWLATQEGLVRYDGHSFRHFRNVPGDSTSIYSNHVYCVKEDKDGNIWAGLIRGGVSRYDRKTGKFRNYRFTEKLKIKTASVHQIFFDKAGELWVGVGGYGLVHLDQKTAAFKQYDLVTHKTAPHLTPQELSSYNIAQNFWQDENGQIWCATPDDLYLFDPKTGKATPHRFEKKGPNGIRLNQTFVMYPEGNWLWVGGWASGLRRYNRKTGEWKQYMLTENPSSPEAVNIVNGIAPKGADELWVSTQDQGLTVFNKKTEQFYIFNRHPAEYPDFPASTGTPLLDNQGNFWVSVPNQLMRIRLKDKQFHFHPVKSSRPFVNDDAYLLTLFDDREGRYRFIGLPSGDGLQVVDKKTGKTTVPAFVNVPEAEENSQMVRGVMQTLDGTIWVLGRHILYRFNPQTMHLEVPPQPPVFSKKFGTNYYTMMAVDGQGNIWLGTAMFGLFRYNPLTGEATHFMPDEKKTGDVPSNIVGVVHVDGTGRLWYASRDRQAYGYFDSATNRFVYLDVNGKVTSDIASMRINNYFTDQKGNVWAFTERGIYYFDCTGEQPRLVKKYTVEDGLLYDYVNWGVGDDGGNLWLINGRNLCRMNLATEQLTVFGQQDGYPPVNAGIGKFANGGFYLRGFGGYYTFNADSLRPYKSQAPIVLTSFKVNDHERYFGSELAPPKQFVVPTDGRYFSFEFAALDFTYPELCKYEYQLEGLDNQWVKAGSRRLVNYTNVPAGHYSFRVKLEGRPDAEALTLPLVVREAFYKQGWFWALVAAALVATAVVYFRNRQRQRQQVAELLGKAQLLEKEKALVQYESLKQQLNPHFLFNSLTSLGSLISIDPKGAATFLDSLSKTYRYILKSSERETVPLVEELKFGETFVKLQKTRFGEGLQVNFKVGEEDFHRKIVPVTLQNLIENAIKHNIIDEEDPLVVDVTVEDGYLVVRNNLQKKKFVETSNKRGLSNLQSFYRYLSDKPIVVEEDGAFFVIKIPLI